MVEVGRQERECRRIGKSLGKNDRGRAPDHRVLLCETLQKSNSVGTVSESSALASISGYTELIPRTIIDASAVAGLVGDMGQPTQRLLSEISG